MAEEASLERLAEVRTKVVGVTFDDRQKVVARLKPKQLLRLIRDPKSAHDPNAILVNTMSGQNVGHLSADLASDLAPWIDRGYGWSARVLEVTGGRNDAPTLGANIILTLASRPGQRKRTGVGNGVLIAVGVVVLACIALALLSPRDQTGATPTAAAGQAAAATTPAAKPTVPLAAPTATPAPVAKTEPTPKPQPTPQPQPTTVPLLKIGDVLETKNWRVKVTGVERVDGDLVWSQFGNKTPAVGQWLIVTTELTNTGNENFTTNVWDWELRLASGATIKHSTGSGWASYAEFKKLTPLGRQIPPTATVTTPLLFDVPKGTEGINLVFAQDKNRPINVG